MLAMILLSKWFDHLKENGIWDNTRIILVSDHGRADFKNPIPENITLPNGDKLQQYNPVLMVKEFNAPNKFSVDSTFMTLADVPSIATNDIIDNPVNPFTQVPLYTDKNNGIIVTTSSLWDFSRHGKYTYNIKDNEWLQVKDNVFKKENWTTHTPTK
jgi:hypothetical protein